MIAVLAADGWPPAVEWRALHVGADRRLTEAVPPAATAADVYRADYACGTGTTESAVPITFGAALLVRNKFGYVWPLRSR